MKNSDIVKASFQSRGKRFLLLFTLFFTGLTSLAYELIWTRKLTLVFGANALAVSTVLSIFLAGLALGSLYGGKLIERSKNPYKFLGLLEILIGASCLLTLILIDSIKYAYLPLFTLFGGSLFLVNVIQFIISAFILIIPTFLIGVAFPSVVKLYYHEDKDIGGSVSWCYAADTLGGAVGLLITGLVLVWVIGFLNTSLIASVVNITLGIFILTFSRVEKNSHLRIPENENVKKQKTDTLILVLFFFSGFAALILENVWIRFFDMIYGNSILSFSLVVASFLFGLGIGSFAAKFIARSIKNKILLFSVIELSIGLASLILLLVFPNIERIFLELFFGEDSYSRFVFLLGAVAIAVLLIPTTLMGMTLPILSTIYTKGETIGSDIGRLYSFNSFGSILGSFLSGFVFFYTIGLHNTALLGSLIYIAIAFVFIYFYGRLQLKIFMAVFINFLFLVLILFNYFYQPDFLYNGVYYHGTRYRDADRYFEVKGDDEVVFQKQSPYSFVSVIKSAGRTYLKINGRTEAATDATVQNMLSDLPLIFHASPDEVAIIGHGGGYTLEAVTKFSAVASIDDIEIDQVIIEANQYIHDNGDALSDPRVNLVIADARNYLFTGTKKYDVIISEPSHIWASSPLFTKDFFEITKKSLKEDGIYATWLPVYEMSDYDYGVIIKTITSVYPHLLIFKYSGAEVFLASNHKIDPSSDIYLPHLDDNAVSDEMDYVRRLEYEEDLDVQEFILEHYISGDEGYITNRVGDDIQINTDDLPILEYTTRRNAYKKFRSEEVP